MCKCNVGVLKFLLRSSLPRVLTSSTICFAGRWVFNGDVRHAGI